EERDARPFAHGNVSILTSGKKAGKYFSKRKYTIVGDYTIHYSMLSFDNVARAAGYVMESFRLGRYDKVELVYNEFKNVATQILRTEQFLRILPPESSSQAGQVVDYIYHPGQEEIITSLIPQSLKV